MRVTCSICSGVIAARSRTPRVAQITDAVVQAIPFVVKVRLYGASGPVRWSTRSARTRSASAPPVISSPP